MNDLTEPGLATASSVPWYHPVGKECELFEYAFRNRLPRRVARHSTQQKKDRPGSG